MGILNVTPDSFFDGGRYRSIDAAFRQAEKMMEEGADFLDVGAESTRPGSSPVSASEEVARAIPVIRKLVRRFPKVPVSIDSQKSEVAARALDAGACIVNDVSAMRFDPKMAELVRERNCTVILMHMRGNPKTMQAAPRYRNVAREVKDFLKRRVGRAIQMGIRKDKIWIDPGIGFGKTVQHNVELLSSLGQFQSLGVPILVGASRKSFIGKLMGTNRAPVPAEGRLAGSLSSAGWSWRHGASVLRVHDVGATRNLLRVLEQIEKIRHT